MFSICFTSLSIPTFAELPSTGSLSAGSSVLYKVEVVDHCAEIAHAELNRARLHADDARVTEYSFMSTTMWSAGSASIS